ncbi:hypothetical protein F9U64_21090 [Gracilibacillus oryzae]|uniref:Sap, sulfolipid-1-addressing protein n=1 Tax=Gracilibacillus oryzae TaxID=1672701 RepID=A0A7C8GQH2_9BACI|nr:GAP family protein [Gracilibacillus oryzae]KAB8125964.1 hypothetical protein F9U64_21090 [Gracilibacillus oryzae]
MWLTISGLALLDSLSFASILITIYLLLSKTGFSSPKILIYLMTVSSFYFILGVGLIYGLEVMIQTWIGRWNELKFAPYIQFGAGILLVMVSLWLDSKPKRQNKLSRVKPHNTYKSMISLGITVAVLEAATMLPFLAAIGMITSNNLPIIQWLPMLAVYCFIMIAPALILLTIKAAAGQKAKPILNMVSRKVEPFASEALSLITCIAGLWLAANASQVLFF